MISSKTLLTLAIGAAITQCSLASAATELSDARPAFSSSSEQVGVSTQYTIYLNSPAAIERDGSAKANRTLVDAEQQRLFTQIKMLDGDAKILFSGGTIVNMLTIAMSAEAAQQLQGNPLVKAISQPEVRTEQSKSKQSLQNVVQAADDETPVTWAEAKALHANAAATDGDGVTIAMLSTGVDYTHAMLGGTGTAEDFRDANLSEGVTYEGFPNDVIVGGYDFNSDNWSGQDVNPIENNLEYTAWHGWTYPTGQGTKLAGYIHSLVPSADLLAYKVFSLGSIMGGQLRGAAPTEPTILAAMEMAIDPNADGDVSDHADIIVFDYSVFQRNTSFFYNKPQATAGGFGNIAYTIIDNAATSGALLITNQGKWNESVSAETAAKQHPGTTMATAASPAILTVGTVAGEEDDLSRIDHSFRGGPLRGNASIIKPNMVSYEYQQATTLVGSQNGATAIDGELAGLARAASAAALLMSKRPELSGAEVRILLENTANSNIIDNNTNLRAEVFDIGHGVENLDAALNAQALVYTRDNYQATLGFGVNEVSEPTRLTKQVVIKNLSDKTQVYNLSLDANGTKADHDALAWEFPVSVAVPANLSVVFNVDVTIDPAKLGTWPLVGSDDYANGNKIREAFLNGFLKFSPADNGAELNLNWMLNAKYGHTIARNYETYREYLDVEVTDWENGGMKDLGFPYDTPYGHSFIVGENGRESYYGRGMAFTNTSDQAATFIALPVIASKEVMEVSDTYRQGAFFKMVGSGVYPEAMCESGNKLVTAVGLHKQVDFARSTYPERGPHLFGYIALKEDTVHKFYGRKVTAGEFADPNAVNQEDFAFTAYVEFDLDMVPRTMFIDHSIAYDYTKPRGRYRYSKLPMLMAMNNRTAVSQICTDELAAVGVSEEDLDGNLQWMFSSDRDVMPATMHHMPFIFNPTRHGGVIEENVTYTNQLGELVTIDMKRDTTNLVALYREPAEGQQPDFTHSIKIEAGESTNLVNMIVENNQIERQGFMLAAIESDLSIRANFAMESEGALMPFLKADQSFHVAEDVTNGTVVGQVKTEWNSYFAEGPGNDGYVSPVFTITNLIPGQPFAISDDGVITVNNSAAIDYENPAFREYSLEVMLQDQNRFQSNGVVVTINIDDINDNMPVADSAVINSQLVALSNDDGSFELNQSVLIDLNQVFSDLDGNGVTLSVSGLPQGLSFDANSKMIFGTVEESGSYTVTVTGSDGMNEATTSFNLDVEGGGSSGGSWSFLLLGLLAMTGLRRQLN